MMSITKYPLVPFSKSRKNRTNPILLSFVHMKFPIVINKILIRIFSDQ